MSEGQLILRMASGAVLCPPHESLWVKGNPKGSELRRDREKTKDRDIGSILVDYQTEGLETRVQLLIL